MRRILWALPIALSFLVASNSLAQTLDTPVKLRNSATNFYLTAYPNGNTEDVVQWSETDGGWNLWTLRQDQSGALRLQSTGSLNFLGVFGGSGKPGADMILWPDQGQTDLLWRSEGEFRDCFRFRNENSGLYLSVSGGKGFRGADIVQTDDPARADTLWCLEQEG